MPFRISSGPDAGRVIVVAGDAGAALRLLQVMKDDGAKNIEITFHESDGELTEAELERLALVELENVLSLDGLNWAALQNPTT